MCCCEKPNINGQPGYRWGHTERPLTREPRYPELRASDELMRDLPGRCGRGTDSHCHDLRLIRENGVWSVLAVRNGAGEHRIRIMRAAAETVARLDEADAYWLGRAIYEAARHESREAVSREEGRWRRAAAQKRIKTRKVRNVDAVRVWIEPERESWPKVMGH